MTETYLHKLQKERKARLARIAGAAIIQPELIITPPTDIEISAKTEAIVRREKVLFKDIFKEVCRYYDISMLDVISARRSFKIALARHIVAFIASQHTQLSTPQIASRLNKDRATITYALHRMEELLKNEKISTDITTIKTRLGI